MREEILAFENAQRAKLAPGMRARQIAIAEDETFHPEVCLVGMEPRSNFILVEAYAENRDAQTWDQAVAEATEDLDVTIAVAAADEGAGLGRHIRETLGAQKAPDLFHVQRDLWKALGWPLSRSLVAPAEALEGPRKRLASWRERKAQHDAGNRPVGRPPDYARHIAAAELDLAKAGARNEAAVSRVEATQAAIRSLSSAYHPVDLETGVLRGAAAIESEFEQAVTVIDEAVEVLGLSEKRRKRVAKAERVLPKMLALVAFFFANIERCLESLGVSGDAATLVREALIPSFYLQQIAYRGRSAPERDRLLQLSQTLLARARAPDSAFACLPAALREEIERGAADCAALFVRASSCVEGRNGQLALLHQGLKRLDNQRLGVLRTLHNYFIRRPDGTTTAERFFEAEHDDLVEWLLDRLDVPARPRSCRATQVAA